MYLTNQTVKKVVHFDFKKEKGCALSIGKDFKANFVKVIYIYIKTLAQRKNCASL